MSKGFNHKDTSYFEKKAADEQKETRKMHRNFAHKNNIINLKNIFHALNINQGNQLSQARRDSIIISVSLLRFMHLRLIDNS